MVNIVSNNVAQFTTAHATDGAIDWLAQRANLSPERVALVEAATGQQITYAAWNRRANRVANALQHAGLQKGDRVAILAMNCLEYLDLLFACQKTGTILQALNWRLTAAELEDLIDGAEPRLLVYGTEFAETVTALRTQVSVDQWIALDSDPTATADRGWADWVTSAADTLLDPVALSMDDPWMLCYTGGTTGRPKAAILTQGTVTWNAVNTVAGWGLRPDDVTILNLPLFHTGGLHVFTTPLVHIGGCSIVCKSVNVDQIYDLLQNHGITLFLGVPTVFMMLQEHPRWAEADFSHCRIVISGGASCPLPVFERFFAKGVAFKTGYGLTEAGPNNFWLPDAYATTKPGAVGTPLFHVQTRIVNADGEVCGTDEVGDLLIRGPHVVAGYWNNPDAAAETIAAGWLHTGDLARCDADGHYAIVGRSKDMIISGGENIYPSEVESTMLGHPAVAEAALISVPDPRWSEVGRAIIVVRTGHTLTDEELTRYVQSRLASYKVPKSVVFIEALPKTGAGKVDKKLLQQEYGGGA
jgi:fatty-acyl-CoA synthase